MSTVRRADISRQAHSLSFYASSKWHFHDKTVYGEQQTLTIHDQERFESEFKTFADANGNVTRKQLVDNIFKNLGLTNLPEDLLQSSLDRYSNETNEPELKEVENLWEQKSAHEEKFNESKEGVGFDEGDVDDGSTDNIDLESKEEKHGEDIHAGESKSTEGYSPRSHDNESSQPEPVEPVAAGSADIPDQGEPEDSSAETSVQKPARPNKPNTSPPENQEYYSLESFHRVVEAVFAPSYIFGKLLNRASARGDLALISELLQRGCNPNDIDGRGMSPVHYASERGCDAAINHILHNFNGSVDLDKKDHVGWTPLILAASRGHLSTVQMLVAQNADVNGKTQSGRTALHWAATKGHDSVVSYLVQKTKADRTAQDSSGWTAMHLAVINGSISTIKLLLENGVDFKITDIMGRPARYYCDSKTLELFDALLKRRNKPVSQK